MDGVHAMSKPTPLLLAQFDFVACAARLEAHVYECGFALQQGEAWRSDEQAIIHALKEDGRSDLAAFLESDVRWHGLARALLNNGKGWGIINSVHCDRLARDYVLRQVVKDDNGDIVHSIMLESVDAWLPFGEWWEQIHPLARWGGRFRDPGHFSFEWMGRK